MRWWIAFLALVGVVVASMALREHYRIGTSPCSINERWDCGTVNHSMYAVFPAEKGVPVADIGIAGYLLLGVLAIMKRWRLLLFFSLGALAFSLYLTHIEASELQVWCILCVISMGTISLLTLSAVVQFFLQMRAKA